MTSERTLEYHIGKETLRRNGKQVQVDILIHLDSKKYPQNHDTVLYYTLLEIFSRFPELGVLLYRLFSTKNLSHTFSIGTNIATVETDHDKAADILILRLLTQIDVLWEQKTWQSQEEFFNLQN